ncbi:hypothetical protein PLESTF_000266000 [Pleodorina starrii]|nr:hypothetical protein PLESTF_000266000 [Pleodorina starrii]
MTPQCTPPTTGGRGWADGDPYGDAPEPGSHLSGASLSRSRITGSYDRLSPLDPDENSSPQLTPAPPQRPSWYQRLKAAAKALKREVLAVYYSMQDPRTPWLAKVLAFLVLAYALSPLDLIPDFIPVLGILDDLILLPLMIAAAIALLPRGVMEQARRRAAEEPLRLARNWPMAVLIAGLWLACVEWLVYWLVRQYGTPEMQPYLPYGMGALAAAAGVGFGVWLVARVRKEGRKRRKMEAKAARKAAATAAVAGGVVVVARGADCVGEDVETGGQIGVAHGSVASSAAAASDAAACCCGPPPQAAAAGDAALREPLLSTTERECGEGVGEGGVGIEGDDGRV